MTRTGRYKLIYFAVLALTACAPHARDPDRQGQAVWGLKPLPEADLRRFLSDVKIGPQCCDAAEIYFADGRYIAVSPTARPGRYTVSGNVVSVLALSGQPVEAHRFYTDETGKVFYTTRGRDGALPANPRPIGGQQ